MRALWLAIVVAGGTSAGCLRDTQFKCATSTDCTGGGGAAGTCESTGYCSFADTECADGRRYGSFSGSYSNQCVGGVMVDAGVTDTSSSDATDTCGAGYAALPNVPTHRYRVITTTAAWSAQQTDCMDDGTKTYLAVPTDQTELTALVTAANVAYIWVGIDDQAQNNTFVTTNGGTFSQTDPLWDTNEPNNNPVSGGGAAGCVVAQMSNAQLVDDRCSNLRAAVCECEP